MPSKSSPVSPSTSDNGAPSISSSLMGSGSIMTHKYSHIFLQLLQHVRYKIPLLLQLLNLLFYLLDKLPLFGSCLSSISTNSSGIP
ncbi:GSCOCG00000911001-RA-CDS [Cotesia congregata]|nr:GSCOCG00000911001-RA-CDS [Cotesia congregata]